MRIIFLISVFLVSIFGHPHLFIDVSLFVQADEKSKKIETVYLNWLFDDMNSEIMIMDYDQNHDEVFSEEEIKFFRHEIFDYLMKEYDYYTILKSDNKQIKIDKLIKSLDLEVKTEENLRRFLIKVELDFRDIPQDDFLEIRFVDESCMTSFELNKNSIFSNIDLDKYLFLSKDDDYYGYKLIYAIY